MIDAILTVAALAVGVFSLAFVVGSGTYLWAFRAVAKSDRHYPRGGRR